LCFQHFQSHWNSDQADKFVGLLSTRLTNLSASLRRIRTKELGYWNITYILFTLFTLFTYCTYYYYYYYYYLFIYFFWSATPCASPPPRPFIFFWLFYLVHPLVNRDDRHLLAHAMYNGLWLLSCMAVSLKENNCFFVTDQTPRPYPTRSLPAQFWHRCTEWSTVWVLSKPFITEENRPGRGLNPGLPNDTPALYPLLHKLMLHIAHYYIFTYHEHYLHIIYIGIIYIPITHNYILLHYYIFKHYYILLHYLHIAQSVSNFLPSRQIYFLTCLLKDPVVELRRRRLVLLRVLGAVALPLRPGRTAKIGPVFAILPGLPDFSW
jgi:hypothetical protein